MGFEFSGVGYAWEMHLVGLLFLSHLSHSATVNCQAEPVTVFTDATVVLREGKTISNGMVVIQGEKIISVSESGTVPTDAKVISLKGKTIYPGFIDGYVGKGVKSPPAPSEAGKPNNTIAAPSSLWVGNRKGIAPEWKASENLDFSPDSSDLKNGFTAGYLSYGSGGMKGIGAVVAYSDSKVAGRILNKELGCGMSFKSGSGTGYPSNILGQIALLRQVLADAKSVADGGKLFEGDRPSWMNSLDSLQPVIKKEQPVFFEANLEREIERAYRLQSEFGFKMVLVGGRDAYKWSALVGQSKTPVILNMDLPSEPSMTISPTDTTPQEFKVQRYELWQAQMTTPKMLADLGIDLAFTSGSSGSEFWTNVRRSGLTEVQVLRGLTTIPAKLLGVEAELGSIESGKRASIVIASGPLLDAETKIEQVWVSGKQMFPKPEEKPSK